MSDLFDTLFGSNSQALSQNTAGSQQNTTQNTSTTGTTATTGQQATNTSNTGQSSTGTSAAGTSVTSTLSPQVQAMLTALLPQLTGNVAGGTTGTAANPSIINSLSQTLADNSETPAISSSALAGQESAAVTSFNQGEAVNIGQEQQQIGSTGNTYSQLVAQKGQQDLASTLSGIVGNAAATNAQISQQDLQDAISGVSSSSAASGATVSQLMALIQGLSGATTVTNTGQTTASNTDTSSDTTDLVNTIQNILSNTNQDQTGETDVASTSNTSGTQQGNNNGIVGSLLNLFS